ncbi:MAG: diacylglycerol kinase (ATP) [Sulfitobacter sp.]|jgi:diacylglycerol kinase (ATP)
MSEHMQTQPPKPQPVTGIAHIFAAASYSFGGLARLWQETAFRHEVLLFVVALGSFVALGVPVAEMLILTGLFLGLVAVEALNTAIECIVDHLAPDWQLFAKNAKDLGSLAVMCCLLGAGVFVGFVLIGHLGA